MSHNGGFKPARYTYLVPGISVGGSLIVQNGQTSLDERESCPYCLQNFFRSKCLANRKLQVQIVIPSQRNRPYIPSFRVVTVPLRGVFLVSPESIRPAHPSPTKTTVHSSSSSSCNALWQGDSWESVQLVAPLPGHVCSMRYFGAPRRVNCKQTGNNSRAAIPRG